MAVDIFLKIAGVDSEAADKQHSKQIELLSRSWGAANHGSAHVGGGAGTGNVQAQDFSGSRELRVGSNCMRTDREYLALTNTKDKEIWHSSKAFS
jgi:type VI secretion system secreted protein Hcp